MFPTIATSHIFTTDSVRSPPTIGTSNGWSLQTVFGDNANVLRRIRKVPGVPILSK